MEPGLNLFILRTLTEDGYVPSDDYLFKSLQAFETIYQDQAKNGTLYIHKELPERVEG